MSVRVNQRPRLSPSDSPTLRVSLLAKCFHDLSTNSYMQTQTSSRKLSSRPSRRTRPCSRRPAKRRLPQPQESSTSYHSRKIRAQHPTPQSRKSRTPTPLPLLHEKRKEFLLPSTRPPPVMRTPFKESPLCNALVTSAPWQHPPGGFGRLPSIIIDPMMVEDGGSAASGTRVSRGRGMR